MLNIFYKKKNGQNWNRKGVLINISDELKQCGLNAEVLGSDTLRIAGEGMDYIELLFISNNYADHKYIELNANINFHINSKQYDWVDLFHLAMQYVAKARRPLSIRKNEQWENSSLQKEVQIVYVPLLKILISSNLRRQFLNGELTTIDSQSFRLADNEDYGWIYRYSKELAAKIQ